MLLLILQHSLRTGETVVHAHENKEENLKNELEPVQTPEARETATFQFPSYTFVDTLTRDPLYPLQSHHKLSYPLLRLLFIPQRCVCAQHCPQRPPLKTFWITAHGMVAVTDLECSLDIGFNCQFSYTYTYI